MVGRACAGVTFGAMRLVELPRQRPCWLGVVVVGGQMILIELFQRAGRERRALKALRAKSHPTRFDISWPAMRAAIREARDDLAAGRLQHIQQADKAEGPCFNMGIHRTETDGYSIVGLIGLVERK